MNRQNVNMVLSIVLGGTILFGGYKMYEKYETRKAVEAINGIMEKAYNSENKEEGGLPPKIVESKDYEKEKKEREKVSKEQEKINEEQKVNSKETIIYNKYVNPRFGFSIEYPNFLKRGEDPANMDGLKFTNGIATLIVSGINNPMCDSVDKLYTQQLNEITGEIVYKNKGKDFYVISWEENDTIQYQYRKVGVGSINEFIIKYPKSEKAKYDEIVNHLYSSFKSGNLNEPH